VLECPARPAGVPIVSALIGNIASNVVGTILPSVAALVAVPLLLERLGIGVFGIFSLQVAGLFLLGLSDFGISRAIVLLSFDPQFAGDEGWRKPYRVGLRYSILLGGCVALLSLPLFGLLLWWQPGEAEPTDLALSSAMMMLSAGVMLVTQAPRAVLEAQEKFVLANIIRGPSAAAIFLAPLLAFQFSISLTSAASAVLVSRLISAVCYFLAARAPAGGSTGSMATSPPEARLLRAQFFRRAGWFGITNVLSSLTAYLDRFVLAAIGTSAMVGQYVIAQEVVTKLWISCGAVASAATPRLAALRDDMHSDVARKTIRQFALFMAVAGVLPAAVLIVFGALLLRLWLGASFDPASVLPLQIMSIGLGVNSLAQVNFLLLQVRGGERQAAYLQVFNALATAVGVAVLVPLLGIQGAAAAFTVRLIADSLILRGLLSRHEPRGERVGVSGLVLVCCACALSLLAYLQPR
jgi:O-antigen/teichoic acid export membrane protein